jgi:hypothetical protein
MPLPIYRIMRCRLLIPQSVDRRSRHHSCSGTSHFEGTITPKSLCRIDTKKGIGLRYNCAKGISKDMSSMSDRTHTEPPLWSIGLAVAVILGAPLVLYSLAPSGPIREGDTAFANGQQRVQLTTPTTEPRLQPGDTCLLDPDSPLIIAHGSDDHADPSIAAYVQGNRAGEWPFCLS